ncbi:MAG: sodium ABC transporter [Anaerolineaceae bacterium]|nr:sodium ABC transporter [Anaerolineaceae bacterium]
MSTISVKSITKNFGTQCAVDHVSFDVYPGEIFGLLGPNGAGKTTSIRIVLDIFEPDSGEVTVFDGPMTEAKKNRIGYLPEERGLYQDIPLEYCLQYLASLKGMDKEVSHKRIDAYLERFDLNQARKKKVKELSKGMQQKAQLISTLVHEPELIIIDEPFTALDPVNTQMVKDILKEQRSKGKTIVMCTHQMHQVEQLCDRLVLINQGKSVLYGSLNEIRKNFTGNVVEVRTHETLPENIPGVTAIRHTNQNGDYMLTVEEGITPQKLLKTLINLDIQLEQFEIASPTLDEIFIKIVTKRDEGNE